MNDIIESVVKGGEEMIKLGIKRSSKGIILTTRAHPLFEEFFSSQNGETIEVAEYRRDWHTLDGNPLRVWHITQDPGVVRGTGATYCVNKPGSPIVYSDQQFGKVINLTFLRLVGVSSTEGISFEVKGAFTLNYLRSLSSEIGGAVKQLYIDFLKPIDIQVKVTTQENR